MQNKSCDFPMPKHGHDTSLAGLLVFSPLLYPISVDLAHMKV